jgi:hypothetical protein
MNGFRDDITTAKAYHKAGKFPDALELYTAAAMKLMMGAGRPVDEVERLKSLAFISQQLFTFKEYESAASIITFILPEIKDAKSLDNKDSVMVDLYVQAMQCYIEEEGWKQLVYIFIDFVSVLQKIPYTELDNESLVIKLLIKCIHKLVGAGYTEEVCSIQKSMEASWIRLRYPEKDEFNAGVLSFPSSTSPIENDAPPLKQMPLPDLAPAGNQDLAPRRKESHDMEAKRRATRKQGGALRASTWTTGISDNRKERKKNHTFHGRVKGVNRKSQNNEDPSPSPSENIRRTRSLGDEQPVQNDLLVPKEEQPQPRVSQERAKTLEAPEG